MKCVGCKIGKFLLIDEENKIRKNQVAPNKPFYEWVQTDSGGEVASVS